MTHIDTERYSERLRTKAIRRLEKAILVSQLRASHQETDITLPVNCNGYGRIHHFRIHQFEDWSPDPLPNLPVAKAFGMPPSEVLRTQVFQIAVCNWHCWYCFVDGTRRQGDQRTSDFLTAAKMIELYLQESDRPEVIDLSGGQPDLVPEWTYWMMEALEHQGLAGRIFLWSDDNLSTNFFWKYLTQSQISYMAAFPSYARVGCFKGYDESSFSFTTGAAPSWFPQQFEIFDRLLREGFDMYAYVTFAAPPRRGISRTISSFMDRLQQIHPNLPLRTVPLKIEVYTPTKQRITREHERALEFQHDVHQAWIEERSKRFSYSEIAQAICDVPLSK